MSTNAGKWIQLGSGSDTVVGYYTDTTTQPLTNNYPTTLFELKGIKIADGEFSSEPQTGSYKTEDTIKAVGVIPPGPNSNLSYTSVYFTNNAMNNNTQITITGGTTGGNNTWNDTQAKNSFLKDYRFHFEASTNALITGKTKGNSLETGSQSVTLAADHVTIESGNFQIKGANAHADSIVASNIIQTVAGTNFSVEGQGGADTISVTNATVNANAIIDGGADADTISVSNISVGSGGQFSVNTGAGADTVNLSDITVTSGGKFAVYGNNSGTDSDKDIFNIGKNVSGISIISGSNDSDIFNFESGAKGIVSISGLNVGDTISLSEAPTGKASLSSGGLIVLGDVSIAANGLTAPDAVANQLYNVKVNAATGDPTNLGDLIDQKKWATVKGGDFTYGRQYGNENSLISLSGSGWNTTVVDTDTFEQTFTGEMDGDTLTVSAAWLGKEDVLFTTKGTGKVTIGTGDASLRVQDAEWATLAAQEVIYKDKGNFAYSIASGTVSTIDAVDQRATLVTISGGGLANTVSGDVKNNEFKFENNVASLGAAAFNTTGGQISVFGAADTVNYTFNFSAAKDATIVSGSQTVGANIAAGTGSITILGSAYADTVAIGAGLQNISVFGGAEADVFNIGGTGTITANGDADDDTFNITAGTNITVIGGAGKDTFNITGGDNISIDSSEKDPDTFAFNLTKGANITIGGLDTVDVISLNQTVASGSVTENGKLILGNATITANDLNTAAGFASLYNVKVYNGATTVATALGDLIDKIEWHARTDSKATVAAYGRQYGETSDTILISGLATVTSQVATLNEGEYINGTFVTFDSDVLKGQTTPITLTSNIYHAALADDSKVVYNPESYTTLTATEVAYKSASTVAGYSVVAGTGNDTINYIAAADSGATISGLATGFDLSAIQFGDNVFTISAAALGATSVTLNTDAGYKLTVGADVSAATTRSAYWLDDTSGSTATLYAGQGTVAGYKANDKIIAYTPQADSTSTIVITGLKNISSDGQNIAGITLSKDSNVTIAKTIIDTAGANVTKGTGYNYTLGGKGKLISSITEGGVTLTGSTSNDSLTNKGGASVLDGGKGNDVIVAGANGDTISAGVGNDSITLGAKADSVFYSGGNDVITGYATGDTITLAEGKTVREASFAGTDLTIKLNSGKLTFKDVDGVEVSVGDKIYKNNFVYNADKSELTLNKNATAIVPGDITTSTKFVDASNVSAALNIAARVAGSTIYGGKGADSIIGSSGADLLEGGNGDDTLNGGAGADTLTGDKGNDVFIYSGGKDVITDYGTGKDVISVAGASVPADSSISGNDVILIFDSDNTLTLNNASGQAVSIKNGNETTAQIYGDHTTMNIKKTAVTLGAAYADKLFDAKEYSSMITIDGSEVTANTTLTGNAKANKIYGGKGADTLNGGDGNDTLTGGEGADTFVYSAGKDVIEDFNAATDKISLEGASVTSITNATFSGTASETLILTINKQTLKITDKDRASLVGKEITINGTAYKFDKNQISTADGKSVTMYSAFKGAYTAASDMVSIDGSAANGAMNITGNDKANVIYGGKKADTMNGGAGADTLNGGAGNDSIYGGGGDDSMKGDAGKDIFVFGSSEGNDYIADYTAGEDKIKLLSGAEISGNSQAGNDIHFVIGSGTNRGTILVQGAAGKPITIIDANGKTTTQIYGESASSRTLDLLYDNNFMTDDSSLDDITEAKYSVTQIETDSKDELSKVQDLLTFSDKK